MTDRPGHLPDDVTLDAADDEGVEWSFDARDDLATGECLCAVPGADGLPPVVLIQLSDEEHVGLALSATAARDFAARLLVVATDALRAPAPPPPVDPTTN